MKGITYEIKNDGIFIKTNGNEFNIETQYIDFDDGTESMEVNIVFKPVDDTDKLVEQLKQKNSQALTMREFLKKQDKKGEPWFADRP